MKNLLILLFIPKKKIYKGYENNVIDIEVEILTNQIDKKKGKQMVSKISKMMEDLNDEIKRLEKELWMYQNSTEWIDWLNQMFLEIESVRDYTLEKKQQFLNEYLNKIDVEYLTDEQSHRLDFEFKYPIVDDKLNQFGFDEKGNRTYKIEDGLKTSTFKVQLKNTYKSKIKEDKRSELNKLISELKVGKSLSLNQISKELNDRGYTTPTNKVWNKSNLSIYIKRMKVDVGK